jgi:hypothetical protein
VLCGALQEPFSTVLLTFFRAMTWNVSAGRPSLVQITVLGRRTGPALSLANVCQSQIWVEK